MARTTSVKATTKITKEKKVCSCCGKEKEISIGFYTSNSRINKHTKRMAMCKQCVWELYDEFYDEAQGDSQVATYRLCRLIDDPYLETPFQSALDEAEKSGGNAFKLYEKNIKSLNQYKSYTFENGDSIDKTEVETKEIAIIEEELSDRDKQNEEDVIRIIGYDPFDTEDFKDRKYLFNRLVDMLSDETTEDNVLLMSIIEIVKGFNQIDKINRMIATLLSDTTKLSENTGGLKSLIDTKKNLMTVVLKTAEDNGISAKFNTNKRAGSGTLSGIIKTLSEIGLESAKINMYDIETSRTISDIDFTSHQNILKQIMLDDSDYAKMVAQQKDMIFKLDKKACKVEEELRRLRVKCNSNGWDYSTDEDMYVEADFEDIYKTEYDEIKNKELLAIEEEKRLKELEDANDEEKE